MKLNKALSQIKPSDGQRGRIYSDVLNKLDRPEGELSETGKETRFIMKKRNIIMSAAACAVILIGGLTVTAANFGWGHKLFGESASLIEKNLDDYSVEIGNVHVENAEGVPYNFTVRDVISDGGSLYFNLLVDGMTIEPDFAGEWGQAGNAAPVNMNGNSLRLGAWYELGMNGNTANTAVFVNYTNEIKKGDVLEFELRENNNVVTDENGEVVSVSVPPLLATLSFEIESEVNNARKTIEINRTAIFKDRFEPSFAATFAETEQYDEDKRAAVEMYVETISVSPLNFVIKGTADLSQPVTSSFFAQGWGNIWFIFKNGERVCFQPDYMGSDSSTGEYVISMLANFSPRYGLLDLNEIEAIEFDGFTVPFNTEEVRMPCLG